MTEARFQYDETLLERCAKSSVHKYIVVLTRTQQKPDGRGFEGEELGGDYDELTQSPELLRAKILEEENHLEDADDPYSCIQLFRQHQHHYRSPGTASFVDEISVSSYLYHPLEEQEPSNPSRRRFEAFVKNVGFVYRHNHNSSAYLHRVSLNRFSDMSASDIFASGTEEVRDSRRLESLGVEEGYDKDVFDSQLMDQLIREGVVIELHDVDSIVSVSLEGIGKGSMNHLNPKKYQKIYHQSNTLTLDTDAPVRRFQTPEVREEHDGAILSIRPEQQQQPYRSRDDDDDNDGGRPSSEHKTDEHPSSVNPVPVIEEPPEEDVDIFARSLNWATTENPDAVAIVHEPFDQGTCGACWAFAATGSLEASASRRAAYVAYKAYTRRHPFAAPAAKEDDDYDRDDRYTTSQGNLTNGTVFQRNPGVVYAQEIQSETFRRLNLSIQELIDCDTAGDQGCTGGNPLLSFYYIHRYGLTSWDKYPYVEHQDKCHEHLTKDPIATVKSWGIISPNHEEHMELVLRHIGPIAVGVNGGSPSFLSYSGGIYDNPYCRQGANHALLITGYGEEIVHGKLVRFWHARNSWGTGWGESGNVRVKRNDGRKGSLGVCGIARSPSVALGGMMIPRRSDGPDEDDEDMSALLATKGPMERLCYRVGLGRNGACLSTTGWLDDHKVLLLATFGVLLGAMSIYLLTYDIRRQSRRRSEQRRRRSRGAGSQQQGESEAASLLGSSGSLSNGAGGHHPPASYGSGSAY